MTEDPHIPASESETQSGIISADSLIGEDWEPPNRCVRAFIEQAFDFNELRNFCQDYYAEIHRRLRDGDGFDAIVHMLIAHCDQRGAMPTLWANFRRMRPNSNFDHFYARWQKATSKATGHLDDYALQQRQLVAQATGEPGADPFSKSETDWNRWFFGELAAEEQGLLLAAALLEGLSRAKLIKVADDIKAIIEGES